MRKFKVGDRCIGIDDAGTSINEVITFVENEFYDGDVIYKFNRNQWAREDDLTLVEEYKDKSADETIVNIKLIKDKDPEFHQVLSELIKYLTSTYSDKYEFSPLGNPSMGISKDPKLGKGANMFNAIKYLQRYCTEGFEKSNNPKDLTKAIHYILFQLLNHKINNAK